MKKQFPKKMKELKESVGHIRMRLLEIADSTTDKETKAQIMALFHKRMS